MSAQDPLSLLLTLAFLAVLYLFLLWVARSSLRDMRREAETASLLEVAESAPGNGRGRASAGPDLRSGVSPALVVVAAKGREPGSGWEIGDGATLGRADSADIRVDDPFASSAHARIFSRGQFMYIEDMGSTNGTYLNGRQLRRPEQLKVADSIRIGDTEYRYQE